MAINVSSIAPLRQTAPPPLLSAAVTCGRRRIDAGKLCFRKTSAKSAVPSAGTTVTDGVVPKIPEKNFAGTPYVPVYVMLPPDTITLGCELVDADELKNQLKILKSIGVDGVAVNCWWGIVERLAQGRYNWRGYRELLQIVREQNLKLRVVMSFHGYGDFDEDVYIPLPLWVQDIGKENPDIYFTDKDNRRNHECLTWGVDEERIFRGLTPVMVYSSFISSFRIEFNDFFEDGVIPEIEVGLGPSGELRYPSYPAKHGWKYPGIGEFQCYDKHLRKSLRNTNIVRGHLSWALPDNAGFYNSVPHETTFFSHEEKFINCPDVVHYDNYYGRLFLEWYSGVLINHADKVLSMAKRTLINAPIAAKLPCVHWWYKSNSHAAELTAGFYHKIGRDGYTPIASILKRHGATLNFTYVDLQTFNHEDNFPEALADPNGLKWHVQNVAWDAGIQLASENALPCYDRQGYARIVENTKSFGDPFRRHLSSFTYHGLNPSFIEGHNLMEFERFVKKMHGMIVFGLESC